MRCSLALVLLLTFAGRAHADNDLTNFLVGPVLGFRLGHGPGGVGVIGIEGGGGIGPERLNVGFEHRSGKGLAYVELDPWYVVGGSLGFGVDSDGVVQPVVGLWEGLPAAPSHTPCDGWHPQVTAAFGYRYTGVHELYLTVKAGVMDGDVCF